MSDYIKHTWEDDEVIDAPKLNNIETGIAEAKKEAEQGSIAKKTADDALVLATELSKLTDVAISQFRKEFAVGADSGEISDVTEWAKAASPSGFNQRQRSTCYGDGYYVIAGTAGQVAYSEDCVNWVNVAPFSTAVVTGLAYGNGRFLAVDSEGSIFAAALPMDTWETVSTPGGQIESVRYLNNRFIAVGDSGMFSVSRDGKSWEKKAAFTDLALIDSAYGNGYYIAVGKNGAIFRSINLDDWRDFSISDFGDIRTALFIGDGFVVGGAGGNIAHSTDGENWAMATDNSASTVSWIRAFAYAEKRAYAVMYTSAGKGEIWISKDRGATWEVVKAVAERLWCIAYGDGIFFTSGDNGAIYTLDLGVEWLDAEPETGNVWYRFVSILSNGDKTVSESYMSKAHKMATAAQTAADNAQTTAKGKAEAIHTHGAAQITSGVFAATNIKAKTGDDYTYERLRNASLNAAETTPTENGAIAWTYE